jgi:Prenyltransferase and squalene oxidase repeat
VGLYLESRLEFLCASQNPDGGWGYFPGKGSWLEPTAYAMLALRGPNSKAALNAVWNRAWNLVRSWQRPDGSFRPSGEVEDGTWVTALAVTAASVNQRDDASIRAAVDWLLSVVGAEHNVWTRTGSFLHLLKARLDVSHEGWPWREGNASWIEPTAHTLVALKQVADWYRPGEVEARIRDGEALILSRRCTDGGWNYGTPNMLFVEQPSYPETTALALLGLEGRNPRDFPGALDFAERSRQETKSSLGRAWLQIALRGHGRNPAAPPETARTSNDIMLAALEALGHPHGNYKLLGAGGHA